MSDNCEHKFVHLRNESYVIEAGYRADKFVSIDYFFCEKCLEEKQVRKEHYANQGNYDQRPDWCKSIKKRIYE